MDTTNSTNAVPMFSLFATAPTSIPEGCKVMNFTRKSTEKNKVMESEKVRYWVQPQYPAVICTVNNEESSILRDAVMEALDDTCRKLVQAAFIADPKQEQVPASLIEWNAILTAMQETASKERLNGEMVAAWYDASSTAKGNAVRYGTDEEAQKKSKLLRGKYISLASNNPNVSPEQAGRFLAYMEESDLAHPVARAVAKKLEVLASKTSDADNL